ncbi:MAG: hypothetical protein R3263_06810 [Myxococcota bacterium]|nr:hypothetical protein [Myxococcota bacterium]
MIRTPAHSPFRPHPVALLVVLVLGAAPAAATDGSMALADDGDVSTTSSTTYYEATLGGTSTDGWEDLAAPLPERLHAVDAQAVVRYERLATEPDTWEVRVEGFARRHETVAAVYDMILVLPLPENGRGGDAFAALDRAIRLFEGSPGGTTPLVYGGETLQLKRNVALEKTLLPALIDGAEGTLPDLSGTGYRYTAWDAIVTRDPHYAGPVAGWARLRYTTAPGVAAPDDADPRLAAWWITWIPSLRAEVDPYALRIDVAPAAP